MLCGFAQGRRAKRIFKPGKPRRATAPAIPRTLCRPDWRLLQPSRSAAEVINCRTSGGEPGQGGLRAPADPGPEVGYVWVWSRSPSIATCRATARHVAVRPGNASHPRRCQLSPRNSSVADWVSHYRHGVTCLRRHPPDGTPRPAPRAPGAPRENSGAGNSAPRGAPRAAPPGAPREPPRDPPGDPSGDPLLGANIYSFCITGGIWGPPWYPPWGPPRGPPGAPPGGGKKCTFFWVFNNSPSRDSLGPFFGPPGDPPWDGHMGGMPFGSVFM